MTDPNTTPIVVNTDQTAAQVGVMLRYATTAIGGYLVAKGWITGDFLELVLTLVTVFGPMAYAAWRSHQQKKALVTIAAAAPDDVAVLK
ncbi:hypothetical protein GCM10011380_00800 [Sphingomonas metalli]|uniref:Uncharacterized protein n=1 Tax=Sphingomonas metalli TaxID=1779358 RepID=A0A916ST55_9SPHN|nr:hypothetical protein [Sphingomonas metalli]GGB15220.1 hypothetical protein GCM10011380_00800 [Sphingomonas metalli]